MVILIHKKKTRGSNQVRLSNETAALLRKIKARTGQSLDTIVYELARQRVRVGKSSAT